LREVQKDTEVTRRKGQTRGPHCLFTFSARTRFGHRARCGGPTSPGTPFGCEVENAAKTPEPENAPRSSRDPAGRSLFAQSRRDAAAGVPGRPAAFRLLKSAGVLRDYWLSVKDQAPPMSWAEEEFGADNTRPIWVRFMSPATGYLLRYGTPRGDRFALSAAVRRAELEAGANRWRQWRRTSK
jgi:hypothetical protein